MTTKSADVTAIQGRTFNRTIVLYALTQGLSLLGSQIVAFALGIYVVRSSSGTTVWSIILFSGYGAAALSGFALASRLDRRNLGKVLLAGQVAGMLVAGVLLAAAMFGFLSPYLLIFTNFVSGLSLGILQPTFVTLIPRLVPAGQTARAQGLASAINSVAYISAPGLGAALYTVGGIGLTLIVDVATFLIPIAAVIALRLTDVGRPVPPDPPETADKAGSSSGRWPFDRVTGWIVATLVVANLLLGTRQALRAPLMLDSPHGGDAVFAIVQTTAGVGGVVGGIALARFGYGKRQQLMLGVVVLVSGLAGQLLCGAVSREAAWVAATFAISFLAPYMGAIGYSAIIDRTSPTHRGRAIALAHAAMAASLPFSVLGAGLAADGLDRIFWIRRILAEPPSGTRSVFVITGLLTAVFGAAWIVAGRHLRERGEAPA